MDDEQKPSTEIEHTEQNTDNAAPEQSTQPEQTQQTEQPKPEDSTPLDTSGIVVGGHRSHKMLWIVALVLIVAAVVFSWWYITQKSGTQTDKTANTQTNNKQTTTDTEQTAVQGLQLDTSKNYGDKYADGLLPVGDGKYQTTGAKRGYVYTCSQYAQNLANDQGGAGSRGPWFVGTTQYNINKKAHVSGSVKWTGSFNNAVNGSVRTITTNDLPLSHTTGVYPIRSSDPAYSYDRNPNSISAQSFTYSLNVSPSYATPNCMSGQVGVMLTGVVLFNGFDAGGRDAGAWEVQDDCNGHPEKSGTYHYHTLSGCIKDVSVHTVIGFALDGFPITGPTVGAKNILTTSDLDECHGITSEITLEGKKVTMYHYVMTQDFPYSVSCFRSTASQPPGQNTGGQQQGTMPQQPRPRPGQM